MSAISPDADHVNVVHQDISTNNKPLENEEVLNKIEVLMTELTRLMDNLDPTFNDLTQNYTAQFTNSNSNINLTNTFHAASRHGMHISDTNLLGSNNNSNIDGNQNFRVIGEVSREEGSISNIPNETETKNMSSTGNSPNSYQLNQYVGSHKMDGREVEEENEDDYDEEGDEVSSEAGKGEEEMGEEGEKENGFLFLNNNE